MPGAFQYKPRFVDIRVRPPKEGEDEAAEPDVNSLKPGERPCDHPGCRSAATARAPKSREMLNEHYWFCQPHAAEYNKSWNFFAGLSEGEIRRRQFEELMTGGRPTWQMKAGKLSREAAAFAAKFGGGKNSGTGAYADPFNIFGAARARAERDDRTAASRHMGKLERNALADLDLDVDVEPAAVRARYTELLKRLHPDANGGDRSTEAKLQQVIKAYKLLRKAGFA